MRFYENLTWMRRRLGKAVINLLYKNIFGVS